MTVQVVATTIKKIYLQHFGDGGQGTWQNKTGAPSENYLHTERKEDNLPKKPPQEQQMSDTNFNCGSL